MLNANPDGKGLNRKSDVIVDLMRDEFLDDFRHCMHTVEKILADVIDRDRCPKEAVAAFRREIHSLKGTGGSFRFPSVSLICHRFEEYLDQMDEADFRDCRAVAAYLDRLFEILERRRDLKGAELKAVIRSLPASDPQDGVSTE